MLRKHMLLFFMGIFDFSFSIIGLHLCWLDYTCSLHGSGHSLVITVFSDR